MQPVADPDNQVKNEIHEGTAVDGNNHGFWPWDGGVGIAGPLMSYPADRRFRPPALLLPNRRGEPLETHLANPG